MPSIIKFYAAVIVLAFCVAPSQGQKFQPKTFIFNGAPQYSEQDLLAAAGIKRGAIMTSPEMNEHAKALMDSGVFETLSYKFDGVEMTFTLMPAALYDLKLENLPLTPGPELDAAVWMLSGVVACPSLMFGTVPDDDVIEAAVDIVLRGAGRGGGRPSDPS